MKNKKLLKEIACVGGGSNSIGLFAEFLGNKDVDIYGVEGAGKGLETGKHAAAMHDNNIGIIPALESSHAIAYALKIAKLYDKDDSIIVNLSGRGDKDVERILQL